jgi:predicted ATPase/transcriptional regulator with XRE-family HTH domain
MRPMDQAAAARDGGWQRPWYAVLRALREARGATQDGWAARLGVSRKTVQRWESGERAPDPGAETALLAFCREAGLFRAFSGGPLAGLRLTEESLRDLFAEARWLCGAKLTARPSAGARGSPAAVMPANLPAHLTSFIGREREIAALRRVQAGTRLLTLTGPGGCGKTRLALAIAGELLWAYPHGVWFVDLAPLADPTLVTQTLATALAIRSGGGLPQLETLVEFMRDRRLLLLLDNCEQLLPACAELTETLLRACPYLEVIATSRQPLGVAGEVIWRVPPLALPAPTARVVDVGAENAELAAADSVQLFVQRAQLQRPEFAPTPDDTSIIAEICRRLDGMPLAIELAAARVNVLSVRQIAARLQDRFPLLTSAGRTAVPRQQTLRAAMDWSYDLLTEPEQALLRLLSQFAGGFSLEAAEAVHTGAGNAASSATTPTTPTTDLLDLLTRLVDKSLVGADESAGVARFRLLETVRQYAAEKLRAAGELAEIRARHATWCLALVEAAEAELYGPREVAWLVRLEQEHDNLRAVLGWSLALEQQANGTALRLAAALPRFWETRGYLSEGRRWLSQALAAGADAPASTRAKALRGAGSLAYQQGDFKAATSLFAQSLALCRELGDRQGIAEALGNLGRTALRRADYGAARASLEESLALCTELEHMVGMANAQFSLGVLALRQGDYVAAEARFRSSLTLNRQQGNKEGIANALEELATVMDEQAETRDQQALLDESQRLYRELEDRSGVAAVLGHLGMEAWAAGDRDRAEALLLEAQSLYRAVGDRRGVARLLGNRSLVALAGEEYARAATLCRESVALHVEAGDAWAVGRYLPVFAAVVMRQRQPARAVRLFSAAAGLREKLGASLPPIVRADHDRAIASLRERLGEPAFGEAWAAGQALLSLPSILDELNVDEAAIAGENPASIDPPPTA